MQNIPWSNCHPSPTQGTATVGVKIQDTPLRANTGSFKTALPFSMDFPIRPFVLFVMGMPAATAAGAGSPFKNFSVAEMTQELLHLANVVALTWKGFLQTGEGAQALGSASGQQKELRL